jgi:bifunctional DNA-binding transcriptional regulator/antitoxin component of YhaV-PrlF toxin-antitoxin module
MNSTEVLTVSESGGLTLPAEIIERYHIEKEIKFRVIETQNGFMIILFKDGPMSSELQEEIEEWQSLGSEGWDKFDYKENSP